MSVKEENGEEAMENAHGTEKVSFHRTGTMLVFLQGEDACGLYGSIVNGFLKEPVRFHGLGDLILRLDEICDWINCPRKNHRGNDSTWSVQSVRSI